MKKFLKITGIVLGILIILLLLAPLLLRGSLEDLLKKNINKNLNAKVEWESMDLSLFRNFPQASVQLNHFSIVNNAPFEGDTLAKGKLLGLEMGVKQLFKSSNEEIKIDAFRLDETAVMIKVDSLGRNNYDIAVKDPAQKTNPDDPVEGFIFDLQQYEINNSYFSYSDEANKTFIFLTEINHRGNGDFSLNISELETETQALMSLRVGEIEYLTNNRVELDAVFKMDLEKQRYTFMENEARVNALPLKLDGSVQVNENDTDLDLSFKTPSSDFKNFLAVIPETYVQDLSAVTTTGDFIVDGRINGKMDDDHIPTLNISIKSSNASFKYPDLPKAVRNIHIDANVKNETGLAADTFIAVNALSFVIDNEPFSMNGRISNLTENAYVDMSVKGRLNLAHIEQVLPLEMENPLSGIFSADATAQFDMNSVENEQYQNIKTNGSASLTNFTYTQADLSNPIKVEKAALSFTPGKIALNELRGSSGETDINASGTIQNLIPFLMSKQDLKGNFVLRSKNFNLNDFKTKDTGLSTGGGKPVQSNKKQVRVPDFLDATINFTADKVIYDDLQLLNTRGTAVIKNQTASLSNVTSDFLGGNIALSGDVSTLQQTPVFNMNLDLKKLNISESFEQLPIFKYLAPIARALEGDLNTTLRLSGTLDENLAPELKSLAGDAVAQILTAELSPERTPVLAKLNEQLSFLNLNKLSLRDVTTAFTFSDGNIVVKPFDFDIKGIDVNVAGRHGLDKSMAYTLTMEVPARYLGSEVQNLLSKLDPSDAQNMTVDIPVGVTGSITNPQINLDMQSAVSTITQKLIDRQKQELKDKGKDILKDIITGGTTPKDTTSTSGKQDPAGNDQSTTEKVVKDILGDIFGKRKKDSIN